MSEKFRKTASGGIPATATVQNTRTAGVFSLIVDTQQYWPVGSNVCFSTYQADTNNKRKPNTQIDWVGISNGTNTLSSMVRTGGIADNGNSIGDKVQMGPTAEWAQGIVDGIEAQHNNDGTHKDITTNTITVTGNGSVGGNLDVAGGMTVGGRDITQLVPAGVSVMYDGAVAPAGWLLCDGAAVSRSTYAALFAAIGTLWGVGNGTTTFNLPNKKGKAPFGVDSAQTEFGAVATAGGQKTVQQHNHGITDPGHNHALWSVGQESNSFPLSGPSTRVVLIGGVPNSGNGQTGDRGTGISVNNAGAGTNNLNPYFSTNFIIKT